MSRVQGIYTALVDTVTSLNGSGLESAEMQNYEISRYEFMHFLMILHNANGPLLGCTTSNSFFFNNYIDAMCHVFQAQKLVAYTKFHLHVEKDKKDVEDIHRAIRETREVFNAKAEEFNSPYRVVDYSLVDFHVRRA
jgi:hypothetical protein